MLTPYEELRFNHDGVTYAPLTDDVYEMTNGTFRNLVSDRDGRRYYAYYSQESVKSDSWNAPSAVIPATV